MEYNFSNDKPIYIQLVELIKKDIVSGKLKPNDKLPSVREFAFMFKVNPNTVQKSLQELESIGLIYTERTNGKYITDNIKLINNIKEDFSKEISKEYLDNMISLGYKKDEILKYLERIK